LDIGIFERCNASARRVYHGVSRSDVPFHRSPEPRIEIRLSARDHTKLQRRARVTEQSHFAICEERTQSSRVAVRAARNNGQSSLGAFTATNRAPHTVALHECADAFGAGVQAMECGRKDDAKDRTAALDQRDVDGELAVAR